MIECKNITKTYKSGEIETHALKNASFKINDGEFVAIMGPSGSGKSTLMHIIGCLDTPTSGEYFLDNKDVSKLSDDELADIRMQKIGFVFQAFNLLPRATALRNVTLPLVYAGVSKEERENQAKEALRGSAFPENFWNHYSNQLSGGMMQRVAIARALVNNPTLVLADEPTGDLDPKTAREVVHVLEKINDEDKNIIVMATHNVQIVNHFKKRVIVLEKGKIIKDEKEGKYETD